MTTPSSRKTSAFRRKLESICRDAANGIVSNPSCRGTVVFGPVPSRRLGNSLGINNIHEKSCSYDCVYCQAGPTNNRSVSREICLDPYELFCFVKRKLRLLEEQGVRVDYLSFVPNGEPTLDLRLSKEIRLLREFGYKIAVFTNSSLLWNDNVKEDLLCADYVSVKVDTVDDAIWEGLNRPHRRLKLRAILEGTAEFSRSYHGVLTTETMLVKGMNDNPEEVGRIGKYLDTVKRNRSYFAIPVRPPAEQFVEAPDPHTLIGIQDFVRRTIVDAEMLFGAEGIVFEGAGNLEEELLGILAVHPMSQEAVDLFIRRKGGGTETLREMLGKSLIGTIDFNGKLFYTRRQVV